MLYHNIANSEDDRVIKKILEVQKTEVRGSTWYADIKNIMEKNGIKKDVNVLLKSEWKKEVKEKIGSKLEEEIRGKCRKMTKTRTIQDEKYCLKTYLTETTMTDATDILRARLHMTKLTCNFGLSKHECHLCGKQGKIQTEHYFTQCRRTKYLANIWGTRQEDLKGSVKNLIRATKHLKNVEVIMESAMKKMRESVREDKLIDKDGKCIY